MRYAPLLAPALIIFCSGCSQDASPPLDEAAPCCPLFGTWEGVSGEALGNQMEGKPGMRITFGANKVIWHFDTAEGEKSYDGYYKVYSSKQAGAIDLREPNSKDPNKTALGIYQIDGDTLWISMGRERPRDFNEPALTKLVFKRAQ